ncbi:hypothetical protein SSPO_002590 [Streptomyces antimycoticus]|uniref:Insertion element IS402-like domain-containing protein n=1 Tax=Streptomyces antimycoticus TaxID=68175 RepID=A0A499UDX6_9ACTN|nr:hypothetical protein SSPO_001960 [Streptomyces antimycoticus]BBJ37541.1 hypothetical protein SSPO_002590 [Streptomyces antimycoticus]
MTRPKPWEISDELWAVIEPLLPRHERRRRYPGRKRIDDRKTLQGVLFVLYTGIQWEFLPQELGSARGLPAGGGWPSGRRPVSGMSFSGYCWTGCGRRTGWTSPVPRSIRLTCRPSGGEAAQKSARVRLTAHGRARNTMC